MSDPVHNPPHYHRGGFQLWRVLEAFGLDRDLYLGSAAQYVFRARFKGNETQDLEKAAWNIDRAIIRAREGRQNESADPLDLTNYPLVYLATPYSRYPGRDGKSGLDCAFEDASALAAALLATGVKVYSPIAHTHPLAKYSNLDPLDHRIWLPFDEAMMSACAALVVAKMDGYETSVGIAHEIEFFKAADKPIFELDPTTMIVDLCKPYDGGAG